MWDVKKGTCRDSRPRLSGRAKLDSLTLSKQNQEGTLSPSEVVRDAPFRLSAVIECNSPAFRRSGNHHAHSAITINVPTPPSTTAGTVPNHCAVTPDSNCPNSFERPNENHVYGGDAPAHFIGGRKLS